MTETHANPLTETEEFLGYMHFIMQDLRAIRRDVERAQIDVDMYESHPGTSSLKMVHKSVRTPVIITEVLVAYPPSTTAASLLIGNRTIPLPAAGGAEQNTVNGTPGSVTSPAAGQTIASLAALPAGTYTFNWIVMLRGTLGAQDVNNFGIYVNGVLVATSINANNVGTYYPQLPATITVPAGAVVTVEAIGVGTVASVYQAQISAQSAAAQGNPDGIVTFDTRIQIEYEDDIFLNITPAGPCHMELMGYSDKRRVDETNNV